MQLRQERNPPKFDILPQSTAADSRIGSGTASSAVIEDKEGEERTLRAFHSSSFSASSFATLSSAPSLIATISLTRSKELRRTLSSGLENRMSTVGRSSSASGRICERFNPRMLVPSSSSSEVGDRPAARIETTALTACATVGKEVRATLRGRTGVRRTVSSVMICVQVRSRLRRSGGTNARLGFLQIPLRGGLRPSQSSSCGHDSSLVSG